MANRRSSSLRRGRNFQCTNCYLNSFPNMWEQRKSFTIASRNLGQSAFKGSVWLWGCIGKENKLKQRLTALKYLCRKQDSKGRGLGMTKRRYVFCNMYYLTIFKIVTISAMFLALPSGWKCERLFSSIFLMSADDSAL